MNDIIKTVFNNHQITTILYEGDPHWLVSDIGKALEYKFPRSLSKKIMSGDWSQEFDSGVEYLLLKGAKLNDFRQLPGGGDELASPYVNQLLLLKEPGLYALLGKSQKKEAIEFRKHLNREILPKLRRGELVPVAQSPMAMNQFNEFELTVRRLALEEKKVEQLILQTKMEERNQRADIIDSMAKALKETGYIDVDVFTAYAVTAAEIRSGMDLTHMRPALKGGEWKTPREISEDTGFTTQKVGAVITKIGILRNNNQYSKTTVWVNPKTNSMMKTYMYNEDAVAMIESELYGKQLPLI